MQHSQINVRFAIATLRMQVGPPARFNRALMVMDGSAGGRFWNFYQENWEYQGPQYRHLLVVGTNQPLHFYHLNTEHSQGEANSEFRDVSGPIRIFGFKGEGMHVVGVVLCR